MNPGIVWAKIRVVVQTPVRLAGVMCLSAKIEFSILKSCPLSFLHESGWTTIARLLSGLVTSWRTAVWEACGALIHAENPQMRESIRRQLEAGVLRRGEDISRLQAFELLLKKNQIFAFNRKTLLLPDFSYTNLYYYEQNL
jgi:hypothetical protein